MPAQGPRGAALADLTWPEAAHRLADPATVVVLPIGSTEQHGRHLPLATDAILAESVLAKALGRLSPGPPIVTLPALAYGKSNEHASFAGTLSLRADTLRSVLYDLAAGVYAAGTRRLVLFNAHGGNHATLTEFARDARTRHASLAVWNLYVWDLLRPGDAPEADPADLHAGERETSLMLALAPERVRAATLADRDPTATRVVRERAARLLRHGFGWLMTDLAPDGTIGAAERADADAGSILLDALCHRLAEALTTIGELDWPVDS